MNNLEGLKFGKFQIEKLLGVGGFAVVYKALDTHQQELVVIKLLHKHWLSDPRVVSMFQNEGRLALKLSHPQIIKVHEVDQLYGQPYYAMEYWSAVTFAESIKSLCEDEHWSPRLCWMLEQIADALDYLHQQKFVHQDVKPSNILVGVNDYIKIVDFGLVQNVLGMGLRDKEVRGTPKYMAPEQVAGHGVTAKTDIYALALIIQETLNIIFSANAQEIPHTIQEILKTALTNDPKSRPSKASSFVQILCRAIQS